MSKISFQPNAVGSGTFTIASPNSGTNRTLTLPDETGTVLTAASSLAAANLTGALPAIDGAALTSLSAPNLTGALPAIDGSALTAVGNRVETFQTSLDNCGSTADLGVFGNHYLTITPTFNCRVTLSWELAYRHTSSTSHAYIMPAIYNASGTKITDLATYGANNPQTNAGWNQGAGGTVSYWDNLVGGATYKFALHLGSAASVNQTNDVGRELHLSATCTKV